jgi:glycosyltransferase involved in cell wall biosynthesis
MRLGIFVAYAPGVKLYREGLGRHLVYLMKGFSGVLAEPPIVLCPSWSKKDVEVLFNDGGIPKSAYKIVTVGNAPISMQIQSRFESREAKAGLFFRLRSILRRAYVPFRWLAFKTIGQIPILLVTTKSMLVFSTLTALLLSVVVVTSPVTIPAILILLALKVLRGFVDKRAHSKLWQRVLEMADHGGRISRMIRAMRAIRQGKRSNLLGRAYAAIYQRELQSMVDYANTQIEADFWYCQTVFWPEFNQIKKPSVLCFPDLVLSEFPAAFALKAPYTTKTLDTMTETIRSGRHFIAYSNFTADDSLHQRLGIKRSNIFVVPHAALDISNPIRIRGARDPIAARRRFAIDLVHRFRNDHWSDHHYLRDFSFEDVDYIFYASQFRPHKNIMNLVKGFEIALRKKYQNIKLFVTGDIEGDRELLGYIEERRLQLDIISFRDIPEQVLAALYHLAQLVITPTLYEGGFPFTFTEGMSVGTPSIMSDIPQVRSYLSDDEAKLMLFDPYSPNSMAERIQFALQNRAQLYELQLPLYKRMSGRTWKDVARDHLRVFETIAASWSQNGPT